MSEYDHVALTDAIVRRLSELYVEEKHRAHINAHSGNRASPAAAFLATDANIPKLNKDPIKNSKPSCASAICGKTGSYRGPMLPQRTRVLPHGDK